MSSPWAGTGNAGFLLLLSACFVLKRSYGGGAGVFGSVAAGEGDKDEQWFPDVGGADVEFVQEGGIRLLLQDRLLHIFPSYFSFMEGGK